MVEKTKETPDIEKPVNVPLPAKKYADVRTELPDDAGTDSLGQVPAKGSDAFEFSRCRLDADTITAKLAEGYQPCEHGMLDPATDKLLVQNQSIFTRGINDWLLFKGDVILYRTKAQGVAWTQRLMARIRTKVGATGDPNDPAVLNVGKGKKLVEKAG